MSRHRAPLWFVAVKANTWFFSLAALVSGALLTSCGDSAPRPTDPVLARGYDVYQDQCASCHGAGGGGGSAPRLKGVIAGRYDVETHTRIVVDGVGARMPAFGERLSAEEVDAVVRYEREGL
jgi:mono/diheme cytochrome c family protein